MSAIKKFQSRIDSAEGQPFKLILLDYSMADLDGPQTAVYLRQMCQKAGITTYICCVTAYSEASYKRKALESGMDCFLTKPVSWENLKEIVERVL